MCSFMYSCPSCILVAMRNSLNSDLATRTKIDEAALTSGATSPAETYASTYPADAE